jgi:26S proteasome non-ATPase regulatory subunit 10
MKIHSSLWVLHRHLACEEDRVEEAKLLVHHGADITKENKSKQKPMDLAKESLAIILNNIVASLNQ